MRSLVWTPILAALGAGCTAAPSSEVTFPHEASRIEAVCDANEPASALGARAVRVAVEAQHPNNGLRRFRIENASASPHEVSPRFVVAESGRCDRSFSRARRLALEDAATCAPPQPRTLDPDQWIELRIPPYRQTVDEGCTKIGLALHAEVDGAPACVELGSWIVYRADD